MKIKRTVQDWLIYKIKIMNYMSITPLISRRKIKEWLKFNCKIGVLKGKTMNYKMIGKN